MAYCVTAPARDIVGGWRSKTLERIISEAASVSAAMRNCCPTVTFLGPAELGADVMSCGLLARLFVLFSLALPGSCRVYVFLWPGSKLQAMYFSILASPC